MACDNLRDEKERLDELLDHYGSLISGLRSSLQEESSTSASRTEGAQGNVPSVPSHIPTRIPTRRTTSHVFLPYGPSFVPGTLDSGRSVRAASPRAPLRSSYYCTPGTYPHGPKSPTYHVTGTGTGQDDPSMELDSHRVSHERGAPSAPPRSGGPSRVLGAGNGGYGPAPRAIVRMRPDGTPADVAHMAS